VVRAAAVEAGLGADEGVAETRGVERGLREQLRIARVAVEVHHSEVVFELALAGVAPNHAADVTAELLRSARADVRAAEVDAGVRPRADEPGPAEVRAIRRREQSSRPDVELVGEVELPVEVQRPHLESGDGVAARLEVRGPAHDVGDPAAEPRLDVELVEPLVAEDLLRILRILET